MPVAQTLVLRRVLKGGISTNSGRLFLSSPSTVAGCPSGWPSRLDRCGLGVGGLVFGTLLGPEATGPVGMRWDPFWVVVCFVGFVCFWFPGCTEHALFCVWGVWFGVVV